MTERPLVSIVLPTYNGARYLRGAVESCLAQTFRDLEVLIVDDASTDDTPRIVAELAALDARVRSLRLEKNGKLPAALNAGSDAARGELLTWTSDDNLYHPNALAEMVDVLSDRPEVDVVYADYEQIDENGKVVGLGLQGRAEALLEHDTVGACFLYRRRVHETLHGYDTTLFLCEDYEFWVRAYLAGFRFLHLPRKLYLYRTHGSSLSSQRRDEVLRRTRAARSSHIRTWSKRAHAASVSELLELAAHAERLGAGDVARLSLARAALLAPGWLLRASFWARLLRTVTERNADGRE